MPSKDSTSRQVPPDFAKRILEVRGKLGLTQMGFAERLGVSHISVCRWEKEKAKPGFSVWKQVLKLEEEAFGGSGPTIVADGAHNHESAQALSQALQHFFKAKQCVFVIGVNNDKNIGAIWKELSHL
ncbi:MAG TPA: cyanophycin synthetase, partial [Candidatus Paceibacterota bacterium]|nr:cyanophycin synthetase [Candidatus Paceibacterota bacterium]